MRITLSGTLGSGKSTVGRELARRLGVCYISTGQIFRELGHISNLDALQTNLEAETDQWLDDAVDDKVRELNKTLPDFVIDSRMAWHFVDNALKVFLSVMPDVAARRIMQDHTRLNEEYSSLDSAMESLRARRNSELKRYKRLYNVEIEDASNYDISVITDDAEIGDIVDLVLRRANGSVADKYWIPKTRLVPMIEPNASVKVGPLVPGDLPLDLELFENFGFFFGDAARLVRALSFPLPLLPYMPDVADLKPDPGLAVDLAGLTEWERLSGTRFAYWGMRKRGNAG